MPGISQKVLTQQLRELMNDGILQRQPTGAIPAPVEYSLTDYGRSVLPLVEDVRLWGRAHMERSTSQTDRAVSDPYSSVTPIRFNAGAALHSHKPYPPLLCCP